MSELLTPDHFLPHVDKTFRVRGSPQALRLARVDMLKLGEKEAPPRQPFNLIFSAPAGNVLREGYYMLELEDGPRFELYVMPIHTPAPGRQDYQAAFN